MNTNAITEIALAVAAVSGCCIVFVVPVMGLAAVHGNRRGMLRAARCALILTAAALVAFMVLGAGAYSRTF